MTRNNDESGHVLTPTFEPRKEDAAFLNPNGEEVRVRQGAGTAKSGLCSRHRLDPNRTVQIWVILALVLEFNVDRRRPQHLLHRTSLTLPGAAHDD